MDNSAQYKPIFYQHRKPYNKINKFTVIGERHSGTNWIEKLIIFRLNLPITWEFGSKHFVNPNPNILAQGEDCLFIGITRNIYDWVGGFYKLPHHVNVSMLKNMKTFLLNEWISDVPDNDYLTQKSYKNIFELRKYKLQYLHLFLPLIVDNLLLIRYEDLQKNPEDIIQYISDNYKINKTNAPYSSLISPRKKFPYKLNKQALDIIKNNTDWEMEKLFNYFPL